jgi:uncharacterized membrane protein YebE (DUF533 family)
MIDAEQLLGKVLAGALQGKVNTGKKRKRSSDNLVGSLIGGLASGKGLITAIGLGVGAYEIFRQSSAAAAGGATGGSHRPVATPPPRPVVQPTAVMPPPLPAQAAPPIPAVPEPSVASGSDEVRQNQEQHLAMRLIRTMVAAAHADGRLDEQEEQRILEKLEEQGLSREERLFLLQELHAPQGIAELTAGVDGPMIAQTMYSLAVSTIVVDTPAERQWLDRLAAALSLSSSMQQFIERDAA